MDEREGQDTAPVIENPWSVLRRFTTARVGLGRAGISLPTRHHLAFQLAHAQARDAVHSELDAAGLVRQVSERGLAAVRLHSAARDRRDYLLRPDLGRRLDAASVAALREYAEGGQRPDVAFVIADGLSALAVQQHALPLLDLVIPGLRDLGWTIAPVSVVSQGRVAIADEIGEILGAGISVILIGERPGLSAPDSLGIYMTHAPRIGHTDAERNCISNVRAAGLSYEEAARTLVGLLRAARSQGMSGVALKADAGASPGPGMLRDGDGDGG